MAGKEQVIVMYENNYPNHENSYYYKNESNYSSVNTDLDNSGKSGKKAKNKSGFGKKIMIGICCGLSFGIFAGLGFQATTTAIDLTKDKMEISQDEEYDETVRENAEEAENADQASEELKSTGEISETRLVTTTVTDVSEVVKTVMPAVVSVNNKYVEKLSFFGQEYSQEAIGSGSGIIAGKNETELLVVTNYHVIDSAEELTVQFVNGELVQAQVKGSDADKDLAVIVVPLSEIDSETMDAIAIAELGSSDDLTVGEPVIAIGNALGYGQAVTTGVVSALNRAIASSTEISFQERDKEISTFIQTDAAINPGNSGGPLLNIRGEVIGINSNKIAVSSVEGMGYAIPISDVHEIIEDLMNKQTRLKVAENKQGYLGISGVDVVEEYMELYDAPEGVYVSKVVEGSGADEAGLVRGDIIAAINGEKVSSMDELREELSYYEAGTIIEVTIMQGSPTGYQAKVVEVKLGRQSSAR